MKNVNILYIESTEMGSPSLDTYKELIKSIFNSLNYEANIEIYCKKQPSDNDINSIIDNKKIDVIFCDITLGSDTDVLGLRIIKKLKTEYPEIVVCGISGKEITYWDTTDRKNLPSFDLFIHKVRHKEQEYKEYIINEMRRIFCSNTEIEISCEDLSKEEEAFVNNPFFTRLLKLITFTTHESSVGTKVKTIILSSTKGGYSSSYVFKMCCQTANGEKVINSVLKCSKKEYAIQEMNNYKNYVKWYLPYTWRPEVLSCAFGKEYGIICYSFAYNAEKAFSSITDKIEFFDSIKVKNTIEKIFGTKTQKWYSKNNRHSVNKSIADYYHSIYFQDDSRYKPFREVEDLIMELGGHVHKNEYHILENTFPTAQKLFTEPVTNDYTECICHGDLNTNNILISDESDELILIDFQETKEGHVFHDFIVFEMCFRLYRKTNSTFDELLKIEAEISQDNFESIEKKDGIYEQIKRLRVLAKENFPDDNFDKTYYYGMAVRAFRLFRSNDKFKQWQREALLAVMLANLNLLFCEKKLFFRKKIHFFAFFAKVFRKYAEKATN
jgi:hypothetical protein